MGSTLTPGRIKLNLRTVDFSGVGKPAHLMSEVCELEKWRFPFILLIICCRKVTVNGITREGEEWDLGKPPSNGRGEKALQAL